MMRLYPPVKVEGQSFKGVKVITVPNQSMTLKEIIKRFIRKESLPIDKEGVYVEGLGDLEKMQHEDMTYRDDRIAELKSIVKSGKDKIKLEEEAAAKAAFDDQVSKAVGEALAQRPAPQGP